MSLEGEDTDAGQHRVVPVEERHAPADPDRRRSGPTLPRTVTP
jgi:hypothetical protein